MLDNLKALEVVPKLTEEVLERVERVLGNRPEKLVSVDSCVSCVGLRGCGIRKKADELGYCTSRRLADLRWIRWSLGRVESVGNRLCE